MLSAKRGKEQAPPKEGAPQKKKRKLHDEPNYIAIHLDEKTRTALSLANDQILTIQDTSYLSNIANRLSYIYDIVSRVCNCPIDMVKLYRQPDGELRDEDDKGWRP